MNRKIILFSLAISILVFCAGTIDLTSLENYANQSIPNYITRDNTVNNQITDEGATLGRVLFYDKKMSANNTVACASCHQQEFAFSDTAIASLGLNNGTTGRHSMRLINARFSDETRFFWDERALTLEDQTTMPIQDHVEMGFSGTNGDPDLDSLLRKIAALDYYNQLFNFVYGDTIVTEARVQDCLAQFIRSIQSFDSKFDQGRINSPNDGAPFNNFTADENTGKQLFLLPPQFDNQGNRIGGGAGCQGCHQAPEFSIIPTSHNNGVITSLGVGAEVNNARSPTLRDIFDQNGVLNGPLMHDGSFATMEEVIDHYDSIPDQTGNLTLDAKLMPQGNLQRLHLTALEKSQLVSFLKTLSGTDVYSNPIWSNPFTNDSIIVISPTLSIAINNSEVEFKVYPNPSSDYINLQYGNNLSGSTIQIFNMNGQLVKSELITSRIDLTGLQKGTYLMKVGSQTKRIIKN
jgi:cytochrome c peroxidase